MANNPKQQVQLMIGGLALDYVLQLEFAGAKDSRRVSRLMTAARAWAAALATTDVAELFSSKDSAEAFVKHLKDRSIAPVTVRDHCQNAVALLKLLQERQPPLLQLDADVAADIKAVLAAARQQAEAEHKAKKATAPDNNQDAPPKEASDAEGNTEEEKDEEERGHQERIEPPQVADAEDAEDPAAAGWSSTDDSLYSSLKQLIELAAKEEGNLRAGATNAALLPLLAKLYKARSLLRRMPAQQGLPAQQGMPAHHAKLAAFRSGAEDMQLGIRLLQQAAGLEERAELMGEMQEQLAALLAAVLEA